MPAPSAALLELIQVKEQRIALLEQRAQDRAITNFSAFVRLMWRVVEPSPLEWGPHMQRVCDLLQAVAEGKYTRVIINIPPGFSKSLLTSVFFPAWKWLRNPSDRTLYLSHSDALATRDSRRCRILVASPEYDALRKRTGKAWGFSRDQNEKVNFENTLRGARLCAALGAGITGKRADNLVIDDPHDVKDAIEGSPERIAERMAEEARNFDQVIQSRLNDQRTGTIILIMQRVHEGDLTGHLRHDPAWHTLILPMRYDPEIADPQDWRTTPGELLDPHRFPADIEAKIRARLGEQASGQLDQRPVSATGGLFPVAVWTFVDHRSFPATYEREAAGWDLAFGSADGGAAHAGVFGGLKAGLLYVYACVHLHGEADVLADRMRDVRKAHPRATGWHLEDAASARPVKAFLQREIPGLVLHRPEGDKVARAQAWQPYVRSGNIILPCTCGRPDPHHHEVSSAALPAEEWVRAFVAEHAIFPKGKLKDRVDAMGYLAPEMLGHPSGVAYTPNTSTIRAALRLR